VDNSEGVPTPRGTPAREQWEAGDTANTTGSLASPVEHTPRGQTVCVLVRGSSVFAWESRVPVSRAHASEVPPKGRATGALPAERA
jgi:hypothetical protein